MKKAEILFLLIVFGFAGAFFLRSLSEAVSLYPGKAASDSTMLSGVAGKPRDVDMERLLPMLDRHDLSDREAEFYKPFPVLPEPKPR